MPLSSIPEQLHSYLEPWVIGTTRKPIIESVYPLMLIGHPADTFDEAMAHANLTGLPLFRVSLMKLNCLPVETIASIVGLITEFAGSRSCMLMLEDVTECPMRYSRSVLAQQRLEAALSKGIRRMPHPAHIICTAVSKVGDDGLRRLFNRMVLPEPEQLKRILAA